jgi:integrase/recombinase XerD
MTLREPKSGKETERAYMPENVSRKLAEYIKEKALQGEARIFPICYSTARSLVRGLGAKLNVHVSPLTSRDIHPLMPAETVSPWK